MFIINEKLIMQSTLYLSQLLKNSVITLHLKRTQPIYTTERIRKFILICFFLIVCTASDPIQYKQLSCSNNRQKKILK